MTVDSDKQAHLKIAVAMRAVRGALGINQADFASLIGVSKPTVARVETLEAPMRLDAYSNMLQKLREMGVRVDTLYTESVQVEFEPKALESLLNKLSDLQSRRPDRLRSIPRVLEREPSKLKYSGRAKRWNHANRSSNEDSE